MKESNHGLGSDPTIKIAIIGASQVGKSALTVRFLTKRFIGEYEPDVEYTYRRETDLADTTVTYELKDTSTRACLTDPEMYASWATSLVIVYSIVDANSFLAAASLLDDIIPESTYHSRRQRSYPSITLIGNKSDLDYRRLIQKEEGQKLAERFSASFYEVSASKNFENIFDSFKRILTDAYHSLLNNNNNNNYSVICPDSNIEDDCYGAELTESEDVAPTSKRVTRKERMRKRAERKQSVKRRLSAVIFKRKSDTMIE